MSKIILLVEDNYDTRDFMKIFLELLDCSVIVATNGQEAVEIVQQIVPDLILMDIAMPVMCGLTATKIIRELKCSSQVPIVALTAYTDYFEQDAFEMGCNELIQKPIDSVRLERVLSQYLQ